MLLRAKRLQEEMEKPGWKSSWPTHERNSIISRNDGRGDFPSPVFCVFAEDAKYTMEPLNKSLHALAESYSAMLRQSALDVAMLRLRALFLA